MPVRVTGLQYQTALLYSVSIRARVNTRKPRSSVTVFATFFRTMAMINKEYSWHYNGTWPTCTDYKGDPEIQRNCVCSSWTLTRPRTKPTIPKLRSSKNNWYAHMRNKIDLKKPKR